MVLQNAFGRDLIKLVSYGPCQFPTLGFVVKRCLEIDNFVPEDWWTIILKIPKERNGNTEIIEFK